MNMNWDKTYRISDYLKTIKSELDDGHLIPAFVMSLTIPDICSGENTKKEQYIEWCKEWIISNIYPEGLFNLKKNSTNNQYTINEETFYDLRCAFLHSGIPSKNISFAINSKNNMHLGHVVCIWINNNTNNVRKTTRINLNQFIEDMICSAEMYIKANSKNDRILFNLTDYDKVES